MTLAQLIPLILQGSIILIVVSVALNAEGSDTVYLLRRPLQLVRALIAMLVIVPLAAVLLAASFDLHPAVKITLVTMAISPIAPLTPLSQLKAGGRTPYVVGLLTASSILAIIFVPLLISLIASTFNREAYMPVMKVIEVVGITVLLPLLAGIWLRRVAPLLAARLIKPIRVLAVVLLGLLFLLMLIKLWPVFKDLIGNGTIAAILAFMVVGIAAGCFLGGPDEADRTALIMACVSRHPSVALAMAAINFPEQREVTAAVVLMLIFGALTPKLYFKLRRKQ